MDFPITEKAEARHVLEAAKASEKSLLLDHTSLKELRWQRLRKLLSWTYRNVPFYKSRFDKVNFIPDQPFDIDQFRLLAPLEKSELRASCQNGLLTHRFPVVKTHTSGSSGSHLTIWISPNYGKLVVFPLWRRSLKAGGLRPADNFQQITYIGRSFYTTFGRTNDLSLLDSPSALYSQMCESQPNAIKALPSTLETLCMYMCEKNLSAPQSLRLIFTMGEMLGKNLSNLVERTLGTRPIDHYSAAEVSSGIAWQCSQRSGYHVNSDNLLLEILDDEGQPVANETRGRIFVTDLSSYPVPIIRYNIGDTASWQEEPCPCGLQLRCIKALGGRESEFITLKNGKVVTSLMINEAVHRVPEIVHFQLRQNADYSVALDVLIETGGERTESALGRFAKELESVFPEAKEWRLSQVTSLRGEMYKKRKILESRVPRSIL